MNTSIQKSVLKALRQLVVGALSAAAVVAVPTGLGYLADPAAVSAAAKDLPPEILLPLVVAVNALATAALDWWRHREASPRTEHS